MKILNYVKKFQFVPGKNKYCEGGAMLYLGKYRIGEVNASQIWYNFSQLMI
jgi:hypothetical protein